MARTTIDSIALREMFNSGAALLTRFYLFPIESNDYQQFLQNWFATLKENGGLAAIGMNIGDYMPPYF